MKKIYLLSLLVSLSSLLIAQGSPVHHKLKTTHNSNQNISVPHFQRNVQPAKHTASVIWSDDFSNLSNWTMNSESTSSDNWIIDAVGPIGPYTIGPIASTSSANGWATFDSDNMCSGDQIGDLTNATPINCVGHPTMNLKFQQYYRRYYDSTYVLVSNDAVTWTSFPLNQSLAPNVATTNPANVVIDISSVAGNQSTVWIRFQFWSPASLSTSAGCGYAWEIDDVSLEDLTADDVGMVKAFPSQYADIPISQVQPIPLSARIVNSGALTETNVGFNAYVLKYDGISWILTQGPTPSTIAGSLLPGDTTATLTAGNFTPPDTGIYSFLYIDFMTNTDLNGSNDTMLNYMIVNEAIYAKDYTDISGITNNNLGFNTNSGKLGQIFDTYAAGIVGSVTFFLGASHVGDTVTASIYNVSAGVPNAVLSTTSNHIISQSDSTNWVTLPFLSPVAVGAGSFAVVLNQISTTHNIALGFDNDIYTPNTAFVKVGTGAWTTAESYGFPGAFVLRPNMDSSGCHLSLNINVTNASCSSCTDGSATAIVTNGAAPYSYTWYTAPIQNTQTATSLATGTYTVCTSDAAGCTICNYNVVVTTGCSAYYNLYADTTTAHSYYIVNMAGGTPPLTYDWNWGDGSPHDTAAYPSHVFAGSGNYTICLSIIDALACSNTFCSSFYLLTPLSPITVTVIPPTLTGIPSGTNEKTFYIFPNPTSGDLIMQLPDITGNPFVTIRNVLGEIKFQSSVVQIESILNLSSLSFGVYFIEVTAGNKVSRLRFVKQ